MYFNEVMLCNKNFYVCIYRSLTSNKEKFYSKGVGTLIHVFILSSHEHIDLHYLDSTIYWGNVITSRHS